MDKTPSRIAESVCRAVTQLAQQDASHTNTQELILAELKTISALLTSQLKALEFTNDCRKVF